MKHLSYLSILSFFTPCCTFAFFCPTNFTQIDFGNTVDQVIAACGKPDKQESSEEKPNVPQEWSYFLSQAVPFSALNQPEGSMKTQMVFDASGKVINITVNGIGVGATPICGATVQLGDSKESVKKACGEPSLINQQQNPQNQEGTSTKITKLTYNVNNKVTVMVFKDGRLASTE